MKTTVITGAGTGIGRAIALRLASSGHQLALLARGEDRLHVVADAARQAGAPKVVVSACDIRDRDAVNRAFEALVHALGPITGFVANSGVGGPNVDGPDDRFDDLVQTNLMGTYYCLRAAQRHLAPGPDARHLIAIASILGRFGVPGYTGYCASKTAILGLIRALALELASDGVQVNAICPGWVETEMARNSIQAMADAQGISYEESKAQQEAILPAGRVSSPEEMAQWVDFLFSGLGEGEEVARIETFTGQALDINSGSWMG